MPAFLLAPLTTEPWHLYLTIGVLVGGGSVCLGYSGQSLFLPNWFVRKRGLAIGLAFSGVGLGSVTLLPWVQSLIIATGWRHACTALGLLILLVLAPINILLRKRPEDMGLRPDGDAVPLTTGAVYPSNIVDPSWAAIDWTIRRAVLHHAILVKVGTGIFLARTLCLGTLVSGHVHQTKCHCRRSGFSADRSAWALGLVSLIGVAGQISLGHLSDRIGREWIWVISNLGFVICFLALIVLQHDQSVIWLYAMVAAQGGLGYGLTSVMGAMVAEIFQGRHFGGIFGTVMLSAMAGGAAGPWVTGVLHDALGNYTLAFWLGAGISVVSGLAVWQASPRKVRAVAGKIRAA